MRLFEGKSDQETVYFDSPVEAAKHWADKGASWLHVVDLDAAFGTGDNRALVREIVSVTKCKVEVGGGIRDAETARKWLEIADRVIVGTAPSTNPRCWMNSSPNTSRGASPSPSTRKMDKSRSKAGPRSPS